MVLRCQCVEGQSANTPPAIVKKLYDARDAAHGHNMVRSQKILSVFLASPGDLGDERQFARDCVAEWNSVNAERTGWIVELLGVLSV